MTIRPVAEFLGAMLDALLIVMCMVGRYVAPVVLAFRALLYALQTIFVVRDWGHCHCRVTKWYPPELQCP